jgi:hypothetical protein
VCSFYQARLLFHDADATIKQPAKTNKGLSARDKTVFQRASARRCSQSVVENRGQKDRKLIATKSRQNKKKNATRVYWQTGDKAAQPSAVNS